MYELNLPAPALPKAGTTALALNAEGRTAYALVDPKRQPLLAVDADAPHALAGLDSPVTALALSGDRQTVAAGCMDGSLCLCRAGVATPLPFRHRDRVFRVAFGPKDETVLTGSFDGKACLFDVKRTGPVLRRTFRHSASHAVYDVVASPDGSLVATGGSDRFLPMRSRYWPWPSARAGRLLSPVVTTRACSRPASVSGPCPRRYRRTRRG